MCTHNSSRRGNIKCLFQGDYHEGIIKTTSWHQPRRIPVLVSPLLHRRSPLDKGVLGASTFEILNLTTLGACFGHCRRNLRSVKLAVEYFEISSNRVLLLMALCRTQKATPHQPPHQLFLIGTRLLPRDKLLYRGEWYKYWNFMQEKAFTPLCCDCLSPTVLINQP